MVTMKQLKEKLKTYLTLEKCCCCKKVRPRFFYLKINNDECICSDCYYQEYLLKEMMGEF